jgi:hypothetical protein
MRRFIILQDELRELMRYHEVSSRSGITSVRLNRTPHCDHHVIGDEAGSKPRTRSSVKA